MENPIAQAPSNITLGDPVTFENMSMLTLPGPPPVESQLTAFKLDRKSV